MISQQLVRIQSSQKLHSHYIAQPKLKQTFRNQFSVKPLCGQRKTTDEKQRLKQERKAEKKRRKDEAQRLKPHTIHLRRESKRIFSSAGQLEQAEFFVSDFQRRNTQQVEALVAGLRTLPRTRGDLLDDVLTHSDEIDEESIDLLDTMLSEADEIALVQQTQGVEPTQRDREEQMKNIMYEAKYDEYVKSDLRQGRDLSYWVRTQRQKLDGGELIEGYGTYETPQILTEESLVKANRPLPMKITKTRLRDIDSFIGYWKYQKALHMVNPKDLEQLKVKQRQAWWLLQYYEDCRKYGVREKAPDFVNFSQVTEELEDEDEDDEDEQEDDDRNTKAQRVVPAEYQQKVPLESSNEYDNEYDNEDGEADEEDDDNSFDGVEDEEEYENDSSTTYYNNGYHGRAQAFKSEDLDLQRLARKYMEESEKNQAIYNDADVYDVEEENDEDDVKDVEVKQGMRVNDNDNDDKDIELENNNVEDIDDDELDLEENGSDESNRLNRDGIQGRVENNQKYFDDEEEDKDQDLQEDEDEEEDEEDARQMEEIYDFMENIQKYEDDFDFDEDDENQDQSLKSTVTDFDDPGQNNNKERNIKGVSNQNTESEEEYTSKSKIQDC